MTTRKMSLSAMPMDMNTNFSQHIAKFKPMSRKRTVLQHLAMEGHEATNLHNSATIPQGHCYNNR
jgi:hypothetical protein